MQRAAHTKPRTLASVICSLCPVLAGSSDAGFDLKRAGVLDWNSLTFWASDFQGLGPPCGDSVAALSSLAALRQAGQRALRQAAGPVRQHPRRRLTCWPCASCPACSASPWRSRLEVCSSTSSGSVSGLVERMGASLSGCSTCCRLRALGLSGCGASGSGARCQQAPLGRRAWQAVRSQGCGRAAAVELVGAPWQY